MQPRVDITVIILAKNEEANITHAIESVRGWARQVLLLDSFSTDATARLAEAAGAEVYQHAFTSYSAQRQHALDALPVAGRWVFFLDADEWLPPSLKNEIASTVGRSPVENGFFVRYRLIWNGRWIRRGYYGAWILRLFRYGQARCDNRSVGEHLIVTGDTGFLQNDLIHEDRKGLGAWIAKHNEYSTAEALELLRRGTTAEGYLRATPFGSQAQRKRWLRDRVWYHLPPLVRPFLYFFYRYVLAGGFLDGKQGFVFHFMQGLWHHMMIDLKYLELRRMRDTSEVSAGVQPELRVQKVHTP